MPVASYLPVIAANYPGVTTRQIVNHTSGIRQYDFSSFGDSGNRRHFETLDAAFARHQDESPLASPGNQYVYSSIAYNLLGVVIEKVSGASFADALDHWVSTPLGLLDTATDDARRLTHCRTAFHTVYFGRMRLGTLWRDNSDLYPSGGLSSSAQDLARFAEAMLRDRDPRAGDPFGWDVHRGPDGEIEWIGHGGTINGAYASLRHYPSFRMTVAAIANYDFVLTRRRAAFFDAVRVQLPTLFAGDARASFAD